MHTHFPDEALVLESVPQGGNLLLQPLHFAAQLIDAVLELVVILVTAKEDHDDGDEDESSASEGDFLFLGLGHDYA
jgi:hypothetical protein